MRWRPSTLWLVLSLVLLGLALCGCPGTPARPDEGAREGAATRQPVRRVDPRDTVAESLASGSFTVGAELYALKCEGCHGTVAQPRGQVLWDLDWHDERRVAAVRAIIVNGLGEAMPAFGNRMPEQQITDVMAYLANARRQAGQR